VSGRNWYRSRLESRARDGDSPVRYQRLSGLKSTHAQAKSRVTWDCNSKLGGILHPKLNTNMKTDSAQVREGKIQRTLKRELKVPEIVEREVIVDVIAWVWVFGPA